MPTPASAAKAAPEADEAETLEQTPAAEKDEFAEEFDRLGQPDQTAAPAPTDKKDEDANADAGEGEEQTTSQPTAEQLWANLTPAQKEALNSLQNRVTTAETLAQRHIGQVGGLQRKINDLIKAHSTTQPAGTPAPTAAQVTAAAADPEEWKKLQEDFPTIAAGVEKALELREKKLREELLAVTQPLLTARQQDQQERERQHIQEQVRLLNEAHPDWAEVKESAEFTNWLAEQPPFVQTGIRSRNADDAIDILNRYKSASAGKAGADLQTRRESRVKQAAAVPGNSGRATQQGRPQPIPDDFEAAWNIYDRQSARR